MLYKSDIKEISIKFIIWDFECPADEITSYTGVKPTEVWIKGETRLIGRIKHERINKHNAWILKSELPQSSDPDKHLENILKKIRSNKEKFINLTNKYDAELSFGIYFKHCNPGITLDKDILKELAELNIEAGFDMYFLE